MTTLPELSWIVKKLAPQLDSVSLLSGQEDPHFVDASPGFVFKAAKAQLLIYNGMQLEVGWLPKVITLSGNKTIHPGELGDCDASIKVQKIEMITNYDRSMGDVHPQGNPHYTLSLPRMIEASEGIKDCLIKIGQSPKMLEKNFDELKSQLSSAYEQLKKQVKPGVYYIYHREFNYLKADFNLEFKQSLEKVPGVLPSATYLSQMAIQAKNDKPLFVLAGYTAPKKTLEKFKELSGVDYVKIQLHPKNGQDYIEFIKAVMKEFK